MKKTDNDMLEFGDSAYYIDLKVVEKLTELSKIEPAVDVELRETFDDKGERVGFEKITRTTSQLRDIDTVKYDLIKTFIEIIVDEDDLNDDTLGSERAFKQTTLGYKVVFNTLLHNGIIKEK